MKNRVRCARFRATVKNREWMFCWEPKTRCLLAWQKRTRRNKSLVMTAEQLVELLQGQLMLL